jgi:hypothetical protein
MSRYVALTIAMFALVTPPAQGDGPPVMGQDALGHGVTGRGLAHRYVALGAPGGTAVMAIERGGGRISTFRMVRQRWVVPTVAYDGASTGLSADGTTLVLAAPRDAFQRRRSRFAVFDAQRLTERSTFSLRGDSALDAISPDGSRLYFVESLTATRYAVRAYDVAAGKLLPEPVVDPAEPGEPLRGYPNARAVSRDGRWAYTLYGDGGVTPFIHALDTVAGRAKCIDLDQLAGRPDQFKLRLRIARGGAITVRDGDRRVLTVDPRTFAVRAGTRTAVGDGGSSVPAAVGGASVIALLAAAAVRAGRRGRSGELRL